MHKRKAPFGLVVVVELGGEWPAWLTEQTAATSRRVITQREGESPAQFAERIGLELDTLTAMGAPLSVGAIACNERIDGNATAARRTIARLLLGLMAKNQRGRIHLTASARSSGHLRHALSALASELGDEWRKSRLKAGVRFGEQTQRSGAVPAVSRLQSVA